MAKYTIAVGRLCVTGSHRSEVANWCLKIEEAARKHPDISHLVHLPIARTPTPVARNCLVEAARECGATLLAQIDEDMWPADGFFEAAVDFLLKHNGPAAVGSPYCTAPPEETVNVMEWGAPRNGQGGAQPVNVSREDACRRTGFERVANLGTGCILYRVDAFDKIGHPYYDYAYADETHTEVTETEDCFCHRKLALNGVPVYVDWDHWSAHRKETWVTKPQRVTDEKVEGMYTAHARAELRHGGRELAALLPDGFREAPPDFAAVYERAVNAAPAGGHLVEVGSWLGASAILMARLIARSKKPLRFTCVDHFRGSDETYHRAVVAQHGGNVRPLFDANLQRCGVKDRVNVVQLPSVQAAAAFPEGSLDFAFLDASHDYESVRADIRAWGPKVKAGGLLAGHDFGWAGVARAVGGILGDIEIVGTSWVWRVLEGGPRPETEPQIIHGLERARFAKPMTFPPGKKAEAIPSGPVNVKEPLPDRDELLRVEKELIGQIQSGQLAGRPVVFPPGEKLMKEEYDAAMKREYDEDQKTQRPPGLIAEHRRNEFKQFVQRPDGTKEEVTNGETVRG